MKNIFFISLFLFCLGCQNQTNSFLGKWDMYDDKNNHLGYCEYNQDFTLNSFLTNMPGGSKNKKMPTMIWEDSQGQLCTETPEGKRRQCVQYEWVNKNNFILKVEGSDRNMDIVFKRK